MVVEDLKDVNRTTFSDSCIKYAPDPTYSFEIGDTVGIRRGRYIGEVLDKTEDNMAYLIETRNTAHHTCNWEWWYRVRPVVKSDTESLVQNKDIRLSYFQGCMDDIIHRCLEPGVDFSPSYQREFVWTDENKEALIDSVFNNIDIGKFVFIERDYSTPNELYEILDGKQRLKTLLDFYMNKFSYKGKYYNDLSVADKCWFRDYHVSIGSISDISEKQKVRLFILLNKGGVTMDKSHLEHLEAQYKEMI